MTRTLTPALEALDELAAPIDLFVRDDDAGWNDARLLALLDCTAHAGTPIDLAVIPHAVCDAAARELCARVDAAPHLVGLHQHGWTHANHQVEGRACEFGDARDTGTQHFDLAIGRARLQHLFGDRLDPFFTPPWNRCATTTPALLAEMGYAALSRDRGAPAQHALPELPVDLDWCKLHRANGTDGAVIGEAIARAIRQIGAGGLPVGLMLHHAKMDDAELALLGDWLAELGRHPHARWRSMRSLLAR